MNDPHRDARVQRSGTTRRRARAPLAMCSPRSSWPLTL